MRNSRMTMPVIRIERLAALAAWKSRLLEYPPALARRFMRVRLHAAWMWSAKAAISRMRMPQSGTVRGSTG
jgi:hypothetical protein